LNINLDLTAKKVQIFHRKLFLYRHQGADIWNTIHKDGAVGSWVRTMTSFCWSLGGDLDEFW
jgi:hypothetical protein